MKNIFLLFLFLLSACISQINALPVEGIGQFTVVPLAKSFNLDSAEVSVDGRLVAWGDNYLNLYNVATQNNKHLLRTHPDALCWSPDGTLLAAVVPAEGESHLYVFDRSGTTVYDEPLPGRVGRLQWPDAGDLTAGVIKHKTYTFGTHITGQLLHWDERWRVSKTLLYETTITPATAFLLAGQLHETLDFDISAFGDEVLYTRLFAPPAFAAERYLVLQNIQTSDETRITTLPLLTGKGRLAYDGESVLVTSGLGMVSQRDLWSPDLLQTWTGNLLGYDASLGLLLTDNKLFKDQQLLLKLPLDSLARLSTGGQFLLIKWQKHLYLLTGYPAHKIQMLSEPKMLKIKKLRRLRSRGLIEQNEYQQSRERLLQ
jgi:hypothetical protein